VRNRPLHLALAGVLALTALGATPGAASAFTDQVGTNTAVTQAAASDIPLPHDDPFYTYDGDTPLADVAPGTVLKHRTVTLTFMRQGQTPIEAEQLLYRTVDEQRRPTVTVTTVVQPLGGVTGVVAYLSFYDALGDSCSPSYTLRGGVPKASSDEQNADIEEALVVSLAAQGYAVTVPDFEGVDLHWVAGHESGWSTLDSIRATQSYLGMDAATTPVGLMGYSGGSIAGEWASELAPKYSPELNIVGAALGGLPVHLAHNLNYVNGSPAWSGVIPAVLVSLGRAFGIKMRRYESDYGRKLTHEVSDQCIGSFMGAYPGLRVQKLMKPEYRKFLEVPAFARVVNRLIMGSAAGTPQTPMFLAVGDADGTGDGVMIVKDVEALGYQYCHEGVTVQFTKYQDSDHTQAGALFFPAAEEFLAERMLGVPFSGNCASIGEGNSLAPIKVG
jgi:hypothetical protein